MTFTVSEPGAHLTTQDDSDDPSNRSAQTGSPGSARAGSRSPSPRPSTPRRSLEVVEEPVLPAETTPPVRVVGAPAGAYKPHAAYPLLRAVFYLVWVVLLPGVVSVLLVDTLEPPQGGPPVSALRTLVGDQKIPFGILFFTVLAIGLYRARTKLPLAELCGIGGRRDVPDELQGRFEDATSLVEEARRILRSRRKEIARELLVAEQEELERGLVTLELELAAEPFQPTQFERAHLHATRLVGEHLGRWRKGEIREYAEAIAFAISVALLLRGFVFEAFKIPSGSMIPTLLVGDHIFVNKFAYGPLLPYSDKRLFRDLPPDRADVIVFKYPENPEQDFIKRVIAVPGDTLAVVDGRPIINGWPVPTCHVGPLKQEGDREGRSPQQLYVEFLDDRAYLTLQRSPVPEQTCSTNADCPSETSCYFGLCGRDGKEYSVRPGEVWVLGDARDNSHDSRSWNRGNGAGVPFDNIKGRAMFVFATFGPSGSMFHRFLVDVMGKPRLPLANSALQPALEKCLREMPKSTQPPPPSKPARAR